MKILGLSAFYHDSAAALTVDGEIVAAAQEERFTRKKHDPAFPVHAARFCLEQAGLTVDELDAIVFYEKPLLKFERLLETYYAFAPKGLISFFSSMPAWLKEKLFLKKIIREEIGKIGPLNLKKTRLLFPEHHLSHAASAFYPSPFEEAAILTLDGVGEWSTASICYGKGNEIRILKELRFPHSLGLLYSSFTYFLGFRVNSGEYKLMGLAPYGNPSAENASRFADIIRKELVKINSDGSIWLNQNYFKYATGLRMIREDRWEKLFGFKTRKPDDELRQDHCDLALAIQIVTEEIVLSLARHARKLTGSANLCLAGGVALNCVANGKVYDAKIFDGVFVQPAAGDAGGALGAALATYHIYYAEPRIAPKSLDGMQGAYLGPRVTTDEILKVIRKHKAVAELLPFDELCRRTAAWIAGGNVIGWVRGRMEFGPRALGGRSILGDPRSAEMQKTLNLKVKYRESFRPFAPSVIAEDCAKYFDYASHSPYMLMVERVAAGIRKPVPDNYQQLPLKEKLYFLRSDLPAVTHIDYSARIQTVHRETNPDYYQLIEEFRNQTGCAVLINTSFNVRGEPIVCSAEDAYRCFMRSEIDYLVIENYIFDKRLQPAWQDATNWKTEFVLD